MIESQLIILKQAQAYLAGVTVAQYTQVISPTFMSSAGAHIRHILDHYLSIINGQEQGIIDYDLRTRGAVIEHDPGAAIQLIDQVILFLTSLSETQLQQVLKLSTEISITEKQVAVVNTTLAREIIFAGSHAIHHFATIKYIALAQKMTVGSSLGIAPATATFLREGKK